MVFTHASSSTARFKYPLHWWFLAFTSSPKWKNYILREFSHYMAILDTLFLLITVAALWESSSELENHDTIEEEHLPNTHCLSDGI